MSDLAQRLLEHVLSFSLDGVKLPRGVGVLDPFHGAHGLEVRRIVTRFHRTYYADQRPRLLMLGINPGRLGAGSTGLPFTDTKRCESELDIEVTGLRTHEPSSDFFYRMIAAAGGPATFYGQVYVHSVCPLGFVKRGPQGTDINLNYYDVPALEKAVTPFVERWLRTLIDSGMRTDRVICIGTGRNAAYFTKLNARLGLFGHIEAVEHPRYVMQYRARSMDLYIDKYVRALAAAGCR
ncbi:MAG: DUF4918 family protein [Flavobacteriales bacterium]|nr:DUF4918 family protein [Flavobacteriales bacterium]